MKSYAAIEKKKQVAYITKRWWFVMLGMKLAPRWLYDRVPF